LRRRAIKIVNLEQGSSKQDATKQLRFVVEFGMERRPPLYPVDDGNLIDIDGATALNEK